MTPVTREQFAEWSRERDLKAGLECSTSSEYLEEAEFYLAKDRGEWPCDILVRLPGEHAEFHGLDCEPE